MTLFLEIVLVAVVGIGFTAAVVLSIIGSIRDRKKGKCSGCSGDCSRCSRK